MACTKSCQPIHLQSKCLAPHKILASKMCQQGRSFWRHSTRLRVSSLPLKKTNLCRSYWCLAKLLNSRRASRRSIASMSSTIMPTSTTASITKTTRMKKRTRMRQVCTQVVAHQSPLKSGVKADSGTVPSTNYRSPKV